MSALANGPNPPPTPTPVGTFRPKRATAAGYLLIIVGAVCLLVWVLLVLFAIALAEVLNSRDNGGPGEHVNPGVYVIFAVPVAFFVLETVCGVLVLRRKHWALVTALVISCLAVIVCVTAVVLAMLVTSASPGAYAFLIVYAGVHILLINLLASNDTRQWCRRP